MNKKWIGLMIIVLLVAAAVFILHRLQSKPLTAREKFSAFLHAHPFNNRERGAGTERTEEEEEGEEEPSRDRPDLAWEQDYMRTLDPALGRPAPERLIPIMASLKRQFAAQAPGSSSTPWVERGPNNVGGRTRALTWDPNDPLHKKVWAGSTTGGLWYNNDITNAASSWIAVNDFWSNIAISCIAFDPNNPQIAYVGTGEGFGAGAGRGAGIWKTTDGGTTWSNLSSTSAFYYVNDIVVRNESGLSVVYAAVDGNFYNGVYHGSASAGLQRSANGGTSWTQVLPVIPGGSINYVAADIDLSSNRIWVGTKASPYSATNRGGGVILSSVNGTSWVTANITSVTNGYGRVKIACAPSNASVVYAMVENSNKLSVIKKTTDSGNNWTTMTLPTDADSGIPTDDISRGQAWYDLALAVDPLNENNVVAGAVDLFRSTNGCFTWSQVSKWSNNNNLSSLFCAIVHADQHNIVFMPGSSSTLIVGNDGGVYYTSAISNAASSPAFSARNKNYNVTQFYACAMHPDANSNFYLAGAQDNGTQKYTATGVNSTSEAYGGDGAFCFVDQLTPTRQIVSYTYNQYYLSTDGGSNYSIPLISVSTGKFINPADYDDNLHILYSCRDQSSLWRVRNVNTTPTTAGETLNITGMSDYASHIRVSPYTTTSTTLYVGTEAGDLYRVTNANTNTPTVTDITGTNFPAGSISCVELGANENQLIVTFFNYGITSVWYSSNGGSTWISKEGNLPDMPVRWALFNPANRNEVILATELGIWSATDFNTGSPSWATSNNGLANVRVDMLQIRASDKQVIAATHGRGLFSCNAFSPPAVDFSASTTSTCIGSPVTFTDLSNNNPNVWSWTFTPATVTYENGSTANSQNPIVSFQSAGTYTVALAAASSQGGTTTTKTAYITVKPSVVPSINITASDSDICEGAAVLLSSTVSGAGSAPVYQWKINGVNAGTNAAFLASSLSDKDTITCTLTSNAACASPATVVSRKIGVQVHAKPVVTFSLGTQSICTADSPLVLSGGLPAGGVYSGKGVAAGVFRPLVAGTGATTILYKYSAHGCSDSASAQVLVNASPAVPAITRTGNTLTSSVTAAAYQWYLAGNAISGAASQNYTITQSGIYKVQVTNAGCPNTSAPFSAVKTGIRETALIRTVSLYPNPAKDAVQLELELLDNTRLTFSLYDVAGKLVWQESEVYAKGAMKRSIRLDQLSKGNYQLQVRDEQSVVQRSLVVE